jgi:hypothetical protein
VDDLAEAHRVDDGLGARRCARDTARRPAPKRRVLVEEVEERARVRELAPPDALAQAAKNPLVDGLVEMLAFRNSPTR